MYKKNEKTIGQILPNAVEIEDAVIGALLLESEALNKVEDILVPEDFYNPLNGVIYASIKNVKRKMRPVDMLTVIEELKSMGELENIGGPFIISTLTSKIASSSHIVDHARIIKDKSRSRKIIKILSEIQSRTYDDLEDIADISEDLERKLTEIASDSCGFASITIANALSDTIEYAATIQELKSQGQYIAIPTGLITLDQVFAGGWRSPDLIILGARPSMGKTQLALSFAKAAAIAGKHVYFASLEMTSRQLVTRYLLEDERISTNNFRSGQMLAEEWEAVDETAGKFYNLPIYISGDSSIVFLSNIKSEARRLRRKGKLELMIIDYLGLIRTGLTFATRNLEIGYITMELKNLAKELDVPIILLSQLKRGITMENKEPQLDDLRESGNIEQDADIVLLIHKPSYYDPDAIDENGISWKNRGKIIFAKYREGERNNFIIFCHDSRYKKISCEPISFTKNPF